MAKGLARFAKAAALLTGGGLEGYAKGTMASLVEQRRAALEEVKDKRAAQRDIEERKWRTQESEKTREFQKETNASEMAWDKERFGLEQAAEESRLSRTLSSHERIAKLRTSSDDTRTADEKNADTYARLAQAVEEGKPGAKERMDFFKKVTDFDDPSKDARTSLERESEALENARAAAEGREPTAKGRAQAMEELKNVGEYEPKTKDELTPLQYNDAFNDTLETVVPIGKTPTSDDYKRTREILKGRGIVQPQGSSEAVPGPTPPPESVSPSQAGQAPPKEIGGEGTREKPLEATSLEELETLYNAATTGAWVRYKNKLYQKK